MQWMSRKPNVTRHPPPRSPRRALGGRRTVLGACVIGFGLAGCDACGTAKDRAGADAGAASGLKPEQANQVLARVGQRSITLGDYAAALERMDPFERMRYQTPDRRQALLDEMINVELLAREAERRGLDTRPETVELVRQYQRDEVLRRLRESLPRPEQLPAADVSRYYQEQHAEFKEPERRRAAQIALEDESLARRVLAEASSADPERWGELVAKYGHKSVAADPALVRAPLQVPGDLGMLSQEADSPEAAGGVAEPIRKAVFEISEVGRAHPQLIQHGGRFHIVRLVSKVEARQRSLAEVDSVIRARLVQKLQAEAETALIARLRKSISVKVDESALGRVPPPAPAGTLPPAATPPLPDAPSPAAPR
jgi:hypothetical protein